ncbi:hypothetical protein [Azoarcus sp. DN11]|uniref:hypothetical protein n=1 Tax=Azoarcus sp. DN11 TaxID=356837 RepID=UPI000EACB5EB|nr:hypothetical protein [Azoarcus sp. DN11]AYH43888.1 hypothetical protein CDA09_10880 [Azoarcus sp. DN11]
MKSLKRSSSAPLMVVATCLSLSAPGALAQAADSPLKFDGAVRIRAEHLSWNPDRKGTLEFDTVRLGYTYDDGRFISSGRERYYHYSTRQTGANEGASLLMNEYLWAGLRFSDKSELHVGEDLVPFGSLRYASHNFFESMAYYAGYEDTFAFGLKYLRKDGGLSTMLAFFPSDGGHLLGATDNTRVLDGYDSLRFSNHLMKSYGRKERNTFVGRLAYEFELGGGKSEVGVSALNGELDTTNPTLSAGRRNAQTIHYAGEFGNFGVKLETIRYRNNFSGNGSANGNWWTACNNDCVIIGSYGFTNRLAAKGNIDIVSLSYKIPGSIGPFSNFRVYNDWSQLRKSAAGFQRSTQNVTGVEFGSGGWWIMLDFAYGKNQPYLSPVFGDALAAGRSSNASGRRFNASIGYYF